MKTIFVVTLSLYVVGSTGFSLSCANTNVTVERGQTLSPHHEIRDSLDTFNSTILSLHEQRRRLEVRGLLIRGFLCACYLLRQINMDEFEAIKQTHPELESRWPTTTWRWYIQYSNRSSAIRLRGDKRTAGLLKENEYFEFSESLFVSYNIYCSHLLDNKHTVRIIVQYKDKANSKTIIDMLKEEHPDFLLTERDMDFSNLLLQALGYQKFPYRKFTHKYGSVIAVPHVREEKDFDLCPASTYTTM